MRAAAAASRQAARRVAAAPVAAPVVAARSMTIPVNSVARVIRFHVGNEENAEKADEVSRELYSKMKSIKGFRGMDRTVCKSEWAYELAAVFDAADFGGYMESDFRKETLLPLVDKFEPLKVNDGETYTGNRVFDAWKE